MAETRYEVQARWDTEAGVWIATSSDVPGLCCESETFEALAEAVLALVPDLLVANGVAPQSDEVAVTIKAERQGSARLVA